MLSFSQKTTIELYKLVAILVICTLPFFTKAQKMDNEKMDAIKISFLTQKMDLSEDEAKTFWPIYNAYNKELNTLRKDRMQKMISFRKTKEIDDLSDTEIQTLILNDFDFKQKELNIQKKYYNKLKANLPLKTVGKFYRSQEAFKKELLQRFRHNPEVKP